MENGRIGEIVVPAAVLGPEHAQGRVQHPTPSNVEELIARLNPRRRKAATWNLAWVS